jgi:hypothetical protein
MLRPELQLGTRFGRLVVIGLPSKGNRFVRVRCDCGREYGLYTTNLLVAQVTKCRSCAASDRRTPLGTRFDRLTLTGYEMVQSRLYALCLCDCGNTVRTRTEPLRKNKVNSCGCQPGANWQGVGELSKTYFGRLQQNARRRNIEFDITMAELWESLVHQEHRCALTGLPIRLHVHTANPCTASVDRIDSTRGYTTDNIQWVHKDVNMMKRDLSQGRFIELCRAITQTCQGDNPDKHRDEASGEHHPTDG